MDLGRQEFVRAYHAGVFKTLVEMEAAWARYLERRRAAEIELRR